MKLILALIPLFLLAGCPENVKPEEPVKPLNTTEVYVPRTVRCVTPEDLQPVPKPAGRADGDVRQDSAAAVADAKARKAWIEHANVLLQNCLQPKETK